MWSFRTVAVLGVLTGVLVFGSVVAYAWNPRITTPWSWNSKVDVENVVVRTGWTVDDPNATAKIEVKLPEGAEAAIIEVANNEKVTLKHTDDLSCSNGIEAQVTYVVSGADGTVQVWVIAGGEVVGGSAGEVGKRIKVNVLIQAVCSGD